MILRAEETSGLIDAVTGCETSRAVLQGLRAHVCPGIANSVRWTQGVRDSKADPRASQPAQET